MSERRATIGAVAFAISFPTLVTWFYFVALADQPSGWQQAAYSAGKGLQFAFPAVWFWWVRRERLAGGEFSSRGALVGLAFGTLVAATMLTVYHGWLAPSGVFAEPGVAIRAKIAGMHIDSVWKFAALGTFYSLAHSALEEYYWRWFVFGQLRRVVSLPVAVTVSALGFMAHHVLILATFFGTSSLATWFCSAAIAIGGCVWAALYQRSKSLVGPWLSHLLVDAAIFLIGYDLSRVLFTT